MKIGAQLYTVRDFTKTKEDLSETLAKVACLGYEYVQVSGTCEYEGEWLGEQLKKNGLKCTLTHFDTNKICNETDKTVELHNMFGCKNIGIGWAPLTNYENYKNFVDSIRPAAKRIKELGSYLTYHNHDFEFSNRCNSKELIYHLTDDFSPEELGITLDVYWAKYADRDPEIEIRNIGKRLRCAHLKDLSNDDRKMTCIGDGIIDFDKVLTALSDVGTEYAFVEQDNCYGEDPFKCLKKSLEYIKSCGY